jgi:hypothetical protein
MINSTHTANQDLIRARDELQKRKSAFIIVKNQEIIAESSQKGVAPFFHIVASHNGLQGSSLADRVVGKAVALLSLYAGICSIYTPLISDSALHILSTNDIHVEAQHHVPMILNRTQSDRCPIESMVLTCENPGEAFAILRKAFEGGTTDAL